MVSQNTSMGKKRKPNTKIKSSEQLQGQIMDLGNDSGWESQEIDIPFVQWSNT